MWYLLAWTKSSGTTTPGYNVYNYSTATWSTYTHGSTQADGASAIANLYLGSYQGTVEFWPGDLAAVGLFRQWTPNSATLQSAGLQTDADNWLSATTAADRRFVIIPGQTPTTTPLADATGGGGVETTSGVGTVIAGPVGFDESIGGGPPPPTDSIVHVPTADVAVNSWTTNSGGASNVYQAVDEGVASDADFARSALAATAGSYFEVAFGATADLYTDGTPVLYSDGTPGVYPAVEDPASSAGHHVRYRYQKSSSPTTDLTVSLRQGAGTEIASWTHSNIGEAWVDADQTLTAPQADSITNYTDLRLRFAPTAGAQPTPAKVADRGATQNLTAQASTTVTVSGATTAGNYMVARVAVDNSGTNGVRPGLTVTDARGNTWTVGVGALVDPGAANAGAACYIVYARLATALQSGDLITFTWGAGTPPAKSIVVEEWSGIHSASPLAVAEVQSVGTNTGALSILTTPTAAGQLVYTALAVEGPASDTAPNDTDTTNGTWTALTRLSTTSGTATSNMTVAGAYKVVTAVSGQTWNSTITARDWAALAIVFAPVSAARAEVSWAALEIPERVAGQSVSGIVLAPASAISRATGRKLTPRTVTTGVGAMSRATGRVSGTIAAYAGVISRVTGRKVATSSTKIIAGAVLQGLGRKTTAAGSAKVAAGVTFRATRDLTPIPPVAVRPLRARPSVAGDGARSSAGARGTNLGVTSAGATTAVGAGSVATGRKLLAQTVLTPVGATAAVVAGHVALGGSALTPVGAAGQVAATPVHAVSVASPVGVTSSSTGGKLVVHSTTTPVGAGAVVVGGKVATVESTTPLGATERVMGGNAAARTARTAVGVSASISGTKRALPPATVEAGAFLAITSTSVGAGQVVTGVAVASTAAGVKVSTGVVAAPAGLATGLAASKLTAAVVYQPAGVASTAVRWVTAGLSTTAGAVSMVVGAKLFADATVEVFAGADTRTTSRKVLPGQARQPVGVAAQIALVKNTTGGARIQGGVYTYEPVRKHAYVPALTAAGAVTWAVATGISVETLLILRALPPITAWRADPPIVTAWRALEPIA